MLSRSVSTHSKQLCNLVLCQPNYFIKDIVLTIFIKKEIRWNWSIIIVFVHKSFCILIFSYRHYLADVINTDFNNSVQAF